MAAKPATLCHRCIDGMGGRVHPQAEPVLLLAVLPAPSNPTRLGSNLSKRIYWCKFSCENMSGLVLINK